MDCNWFRRWWTFFEVTSIVGSDVEPSPLVGFIAASDSWEGTPFTPDNWLVLTNSIDLTGIADATLEFTVGTYQTNGYFIGDRLQVSISTSNDPAVLVTKTPIFDQTVGAITPADDRGANSAVNIAPLDLSAFAGQSVYIAFRHFDSIDINSVLLDNIIVNGTLSTDEFSATNFTQYFNLNSNELRLNVSIPMQNIKLFNTLGQEIVNRNLSNTEEVISLSNISTGIYIAQVTIGNNTETFRLIKR
jgi:hypothetical protein